MSALAFCPGEPGVVRDVVMPTLVTVRDPDGADPDFLKPCIGAQTRVRTLGEIVLEHVVRLPGGAVRAFPPSWVTVHAGGLVLPLRSI